MTETHGNAYEKVGRAGWSVHVGGREEGSTEEEPVALSTLWEEVKREQKKGMVKKGRDANSKSL